MSENHTIVSHAEWEQARIALLAKEKEFTRRRDELSAARRDLPWERVEKKYVFDGRAGKRTLGEIFDGRSQLVVYHLMFNPDWNEACIRCSWWADNFERNAVHLNHRDVTMAAISRAAFAKIEAFRKRLGWTFPWYSSGDTDFNYDYQASYRADEVARGEAYHNYQITKNKLTDRTGISVFYKNATGEIFHTYSCYARGVEMMNAGYHYLDLVPKGRNETGLPSPMAWVHLRDSYADQG
jgi:predicted dithiol-disulfide oxidoreductase (DUF899 family)